MVHQNLHCSHWITTAFFSSQYMRWSKSVLAFKSLSHVLSSSKILSVQMAGVYESIHANMNCHRLPSIRILWCLIPSEYSSSNSCRDMTSSWSTVAEFSHVYPLLWLLQVPWQLPHPPGVFFFGKILSYARLRKAFRSCTRFFQVSFHPTRFMIIFLTFALQTSFRFLPSSNFADCVHNGRVWWLGFRSFLLFIFSRLPMTAVLVAHLCNIQVRIYFYISVYDLILINPSLFMNSNPNSTIVLFPSLSVSFFILILHIVIMFFKFNLPFCPSVYILPQIARI